MTVNTQDELIALLFEARATLTDIADTDGLNEDDSLLLQKIVAVTDASVSMDKALKLPTLKPTGDAYRDKLLSEAINLRA